VVHFKIDAGAVDLLSQERRVRLSQRYGQVDALLSFLPEREEPAAAAFIGEAAYRVAFTAALTGKTHISIMIRQRV
jgi:hypothetical protein